MYKAGAIAGKFLPPHRGHINAIINAATQCERLYVVVSDNRDYTARLCGRDGIPTMDLKLRTRWLSQELSELDHIRILMLDEEGIPEFPDGWALWSQRLLELLPEPVEVMFGGEEDYAGPMAQYLPTMKYVLLDYKRSQYPISGTEIRSNPLKHWDYIPGAARPFFAKKILLTGTESVGKTTLTKYLAKIFHTSWSPEIGRYYSARHMGGNEDVFVPHDFEMIAYEQYLSDMDALRHANRFVFFDSDAVVTLYYARMYTQDPEDFPGVKRFIDPGRYDCVIMLTPDVAWVDDGLRFNSEEKLRWELHAKLVKMYEEYGFGGKIHTISGDYNARLQQVAALVRAMGSS